MADLKEALGNLVKSSTEKMARLSPEVLALLNKQIQNELFSGQIYNAIASWMDDKGYTNMTKLFKKYGDEEFTHMNKVYEFLFDRNSKAITPSCDKPRGDYKNCREVFEESLKHEIEVTANWQLIADTACKGGDKTTVFFTQWFLNEQISEEQKFRNVLFVMDQGMPEWFIDFNIEKIVGE